MYGPLFKGTFLRVKKANKGTKPLPPQDWRGKGRKWCSLVRTGALGHLTEAVAIEEHSCYRPWHHEGEGARKKYPDVFLLPFGLLPMPSIDQTKLEVRGREPGWCSLRVSSPESREEQRSEWVWWERSKLSITSNWPYTQLQGPGGAVGRLTQIGLNQSLHPEVCW